MVTNENLKRKMKKKKDSSAPTINVKIGSGEAKTGTQKRDINESKPLVVETKHGNDANRLSSRRKNRRSSSSSVSSRKRSANKLDGYNDVRDEPLRREVDEKSQSRLFFEIQKFSVVEPLELANYSKPIKDVEEDRTATAANAAALIQKVYRNFRAEMNAVKKDKQVATTAAHRNDAARIIQTTYRIYATEKFCFKIARDLLCGDLLQQWFDARAIIIQKTFRGYSVRKHTLDYYKFKKWLKFVAKKNDEMAEETKKHLMTEKIEKQKEDEKRAQQHSVEIAIKFHHLLRTRHIPGVYSIKNSRCLSEFEQFLKSFNYTDYVKQLRMVRSNEQAEYCRLVDQVRSKLADKKCSGKLARCARHWSGRDVDLVDEEKHKTRGMIAAGCGVDHGRSFQIGKVNQPVYIRSIFADNADSNNGAKQLEHNSVVGQYRSDDACQRVMKQKKSHFNQSVQNGKWFRKTDTMRRQKRE